MKKALSFGSGPFLCLRFKNAKHNITNFANEMDVADQPI